MNSAEKIAQLKQQLAEALKQSYCPICGKILESCDGRINLKTGCDAHPIFQFDINQPWCPDCLKEVADGLSDENDRLQDDIIELRRMLNILDDDLR